MTIRIANINRRNHQLQSAMRGFATRAALGMLVLAVLLAGHAAPAQELACDPASGQTCSPDQGWIEGPTGPMWAEFEWVDGDPVFEGDILVELVGESDATVDGAIGMGSINRWPGCVIPYTIDPDLGNQTRVTDAIAHWHENTSVRLVPRSPQDVNFVTFQPSTGCSSFVGMLGGDQPINLADGCGTGSTIHEIGHAFGLWHEQSREDRDNFVQINWANITPGRAGNFQTYSSGQGADAGPYDFGSIMHYPTWAFSDNGQPTIVALQTLPPGVVMGQRVGLSEGDLATVAAVCDRDVIDFETDGTGAPSGSAISSDEYAAQGVSIIDSAPGNGITYLNTTNPANVGTSISGKYANVGAFAGIDTRIELSFDPPVTAVEFDWASGAGAAFVEVKLFGDDDVLLQSETSPTDSTFQNGANFTVPAGSYEGFAAASEIHKVTIEDQPGATRVLILDNVEFRSTPIQLTNDVPMSGISGARTDERHFMLEVPTNQDELVFETSGGAGDADLYVRFGQQPTTSNWDCRPYRSGNNETCQFDNPNDGTWYVMMRGYSSFAGVELLGTYRLATDADGDGIADLVDNCTLIANPSQLDADVDGFGNICDGDFNNDGAVNPDDIPVLAVDFQTGLDSGTGSDMNGDGAVNAGEIEHLVDQLNQGMPGPSALGCAGSVPCSAP